MAALGPLIVEGALSSAVYGPASCRKVWLLVCWPIVHRRRFYVAGRRNCTMSAVMMQVCVTKTPRIMVLSKSVETFA